MHESRFLQSGSLHYTPTTKPPPSKWRSFGVVAKFRKILKGERQKQEQEESEESMGEQGDESWELVSKETEEKEIQ